MIISLYILKINAIQDGLKIPKIAYEVYYPWFGDYLIKFNLTVWENIKIDLSISILFTGDLNKVNSNNYSYNDVWYTRISENGKDVLY